MSSRFVVLLACIAGAVVRAQSTSTITGRVTDPSGAAVNGAAIEAVNESTNFTHRTVSSTSGNFVLELLPVGSYALSARAPGFKAFHQRGITLQVNQRASLDIALELGQVSEQITVEGDVTRVDTVSGTLRQVVDSARIQGLPLNGRNVLQLQLLLPGVVAAGTAEHVGGLPGYAVNGGIAASNNYFLDGGEFIDPYFNAPQFFPNPDALSGVYDPDQRVERGIRPQPQRGDRSRNTLGNELLPRGRLRVLPQHTPECPEFLRGQRLSVSPESVRRVSGRAGGSQQAVLFRLVGIVQAVRVAWSFDDYCSERPGAARRLWRAPTSLDRSHDTTAVPRQRYSSEPAQFRFPAVP